MEKGVANNHDVTLYGLLASVFKGNGGLKGRRETNHRNDPAICGSIGLVTCETASSSCGSL